MIHGLFENAGVREALLGTLRKRRGIAAPVGGRPESAVDEYDRLADVVRGNVDMKLLRRVMRLDD
jgi:adenosylcobyric acid synthase